MVKQATTIQFDEALDRKLRLYKKASGMPLAAIASRAIDAFIDAELRQNDGLRAKYEAEEATAIATAGVSMIPRRNRKKAEGIHQSEAKK